MKKTWATILIIALLVCSCSQVLEKKTEVVGNTLMVRIAEIEIEPKFLEEYLVILKEEAEASVRSEPGVICIFPMFQKEKPTEIRLLEIYASKAAYESHLLTPHFRYYKMTTMPMVKDLRLVDMEAIDPDAMPQLFTKLNNP